MEEKKQNKGKMKSAVPATKGELIAFASEVGISVAVPLAILAFVGRSIDKTYDTTPAFLVVGLLLSIVSTTIIIWKKVKNFI